MKRSKDMVLVVSLALILMGLALIWWGRASALEATQGNIGWLHDLEPMAVALMELDAWEDEEEPWER